jgi:hypothetical protein
MKVWERKLFNQIFVCLFQMYAGRRIVVQVTRVILSSDASHARRSRPAGTGQTGPVRTTLVRNSTQAQHRRVRIFI